MVQGASTSLFQAAQQWSTKFSQDVNTRLDSQLSRMNCHTFSCKINSGHLAGGEPLRVCRRLPFLRGWGDDEEDGGELLAGGARAGGPPRAGRGWRAPDAVGRDHLGCVQDWLHVGDAAQLGAPSRAWRRRNAQRLRLGRRPGPTTAERGRIKVLEREVRGLRQADEILRKASACFAEGELDRPFKR